MAYIYTYFVSFQLPRRGAYGTCESDTPQPITHSKHVHAIEHGLAQQLGEPVMVTNFQFLRKTKVPDTTPGSNGRRR